MNRPSEAPIDENSTAIAHPASAPSPSDTPPNHANPASSDDAPDDAVEGVDVATLLGPANVPAPLHEPMPKDEDGRPDWMHLQALVVAVEVLISAGMTSEARPLGRATGSARRRTELQTRQGFDQGCASRR